MCKFGKARETRKNEVARGASSQDRREEPLEGETESGGAPACKEGRVTNWVSSFRLEARCG